MCDGWAIWEGLIFSLMSQFIPNIRASFPCLTLMCAMTSVAGTRRSD
jgi:hypothetical protein